MGNHRFHSWLLLVSILLAQTYTSQGWFFSGKKETNSNNKRSDERVNSKGWVGDFAMEAFNDRKGIELLDNAKHKMLASDKCMQNAYQHVFASCAKILADEELKSRLAWHLSDCFQQSSGRERFPNCDSKSPMSTCLKKLNDHSHHSFLTFFLEANNICHQLQNEAFRYRTESLVNDLAHSAERAEEKLEIIEQREGQILKNSEYIQDSILKIDDRTQEVMEKTRNVEENVNSVLKHSEEIYKQSVDIAALQSELTEDQQKMKEKMEEGMDIIQDSYKNLGVEIDSIKNETIEIEKEIEKVGDAMFSRMNTLQIKADDIGNMAGISLEKQKELIESQTHTLHSLTNFQSQALEESRNLINSLAEFGRIQQEELLQRQEQLQRAHDHLIENSRTLLKAQEEFESKQTSMFLAIDKLFALHNALLLESRMIKTFLYYSLAIVMVYMFTSTKQTYNVRPWLYIGLGVTLFIESIILRYATNSVEQPLWLISLLRWFAATLGAVQFLYAVFTYRDYEVMNYQMLLTLNEKVNGIVKKKELEWEVEDDEDSEVDWRKWVVDELPEDVDDDDKLVDPDYIVCEEIGENSLGNTSSSQRNTSSSQRNTSSAQRYNLRNRR